MRGRIGRWVVAGVGALFVLTMLGGPAHAQEGEEQKKEKKQKRERPKPMELTLSGTITKAEAAPKARPSKKKEDAEEDAEADEAKEKKAKNAPKPRVTYTLAATDGQKVMIPTPRPPRKKKGKDAGNAPAAINLDDYLNVPVTATVLGFQMKKGEKTMTRVIKVLKIEKQNIEEAGPDGAKDGDAGEPAEFE